MPTVALEQKSSTDPPAAEHVESNTILDTVFDTYNHLKQFYSDYAEETGFIPADLRKAYFDDPEEYERLFKEPMQGKTSRRGIIACSKKSHGRSRGSGECCFKMCYLFDNKRKVFTLQDQSILAHNHPLRPQMVFMDGKFRVVYESFLTPEEACFIKAQSLGRIFPPQMSVNLEEKFPGRSFSPRLLDRLRNKHIVAKYGPDGHNLTDLFEKGEIIKQLGGVFVVSPDADFSIKAIHCQTKLMGDYADVYGRDGFLMSDGTFKISKYDWCFVFWMAVDCLLRSKFVGYSANFTENSAVIIDGEIFKH